MKNKLVLLIPLFFSELNSSLEKVLFFNKRGTYL